MPIPMFACGTCKHVYSTEAEALACEALGDPGIHKYSIGQRLGKDGWIYVVDTFVYLSSSGGNRPTRRSHLLGYNVIVGGRDRPQFSSESSLDKMIAHSYTK